MEETKIVPIENISSFRSREEHEVRGNFPMPLIQSLLYLIFSFCPFHFTDLLFL
jgi:hypothetical protein